MKVKLSKPREVREEKRAKGRVIINIYRSILPFLPSLPLLYPLARVGQKISVWHNKNLKLISIWPVFQGKEGKKGRVSLLLSLILFPLPKIQGKMREEGGKGICLLYTSPSPRDGLLSRMPSSA